MNEQELDRMFQEKPSFSQAAEKQFQNKIKRAVGRTIYRRGVITVVLCAILVSGLYFGTGKAADLLFYDPAKESKYLMAEENPYEEFTVLLEDTICTYFPGQYCWVLGKPESHGFSRYNTDLLITDAYGPKALAGPADAQFKISFSNLDAGHVPLYINADEFLDPANPGKENAQWAPSLDTIRQELLNLPNSAYLDVSFSFPSSLSSDQVAELNKNLPNSHIRWLALEDQNTTQYAFASGGMFLDHIRGEEMTPEGQEKYPNYQLTSQFTGKDLEECLISRIQFLVDHPDFVKLMESQFGDMISLNRLNQRLANAKEKWACYGMRITGSPDTILELMESHKATRVIINNVKISRFEK